MTIEVKPILWCSILLILASTDCLAWCFLWTPFAPGLGSPCKFPVASAGPNCRKPMSPTRGNFCLPGCIGARGSPVMPDETPANTCLGVEVLISTFSFCFPPTSLLCYPALHLTPVSASTTLLLPAMSSFFLSLYSNHPSLAKMLSMALPCSCCAFFWRSSQAHCLWYNSFRPSLVCFKPLLFSWIPNSTSPNLWLTCSSWMATVATPSAASTWWHQWRFLLKESPNLAHHFLLSTEWFC